MGETAQGWKMFCSKSELIHKARETCPEGKIQQEMRRPVSHGENRHSDRRRCGSLEEAPLTGSEFPVTGNNPESLKQGNLQKRRVCLVTG